jgi:hypothetical protein
MTHQNEIIIPTLVLNLDDKENLMSGKESDEREMPEGFVPSEFDVLVGWARQNFHHGEKRHAEK